MKIFFIIFTINFVALCNILAEEFDFEEVEGFRLTEDAEGNIKKVETVRFKTSLSLVNQFITARQKSIFNWEEEKLMKEIPDFITEKVDYSLTKLTYAPILTYSNKSDRNIFYLFFSASTLHNNNQYIDTIFEKYGLEFQRRIERGFKRRASLYYGIRLESVKNIDSIKDDKANFTDVYIANFFYSLRVDLSYIFFKINLEAQTYKAKDTETREDAVGDVFIKFYLDEGLDLFLQARANVDTDFILKKGSNFERYGSINFKGGFTHDVDKEIALSIFFSYENNKRYGFNSQELGFSISYKLSD